MGNTLNKVIAVTAIFTSVTFLISCSHKDESRIKDYILTEKDLIPEGVAFDEATQTIYISSTYKRKIIAIDKDGNIKDFVSEAQDDIKSVIGMEVDEKKNCLWAISCEAEQVLPLKNPGKEQWRSSVYQFSLKDGKLIKRFSLDKDSVFLNDLTVAEDGTVYITESMQKDLYVLKPGADTLEFFTKINSNQFINGVSFANNPGVLYVAATEGIFSVDLVSRSMSLLPVKGSLKPLDIDGLSFYKDHFIAHQSTAVTRFYLSDSGGIILKADTLNSGKEFNASTTGEVSGGNYYFIVNSQIQSGIDYEKRKLKPMDSLSDIIIRKIKL